MAQNINYQHLYYFWNVVREDSFTKASKKLGLAQPTISGQIATFEKSLGSKLLTRQGRRIFLTDTGHIVFNYAEKIFNLGEKMKDDIKSSSFIYYHSLVIGYRNSIPSQIIGKISDFFFDKIQEYRLTCLCDNNDSILNGVARKYLDAAITDEPLSYVNGQPLYSHLLFESEISLLCHSKYAENYKLNLPTILEKSPCIVPSHNTRLRCIVDEYFSSQQIKPIMISEVENYDVMLNMIKNSPYLLFAPSIMTKDIEQIIDFCEIHRLNKASIKYYAVTINKKPDKDLISYIIKKSQTFGD